MPPILPTLTLHRSDTDIGALQGARYRVLGTAAPGRRAVRSLVTAWAERDQICCVELVLGDERHVLVPMLNERLARDA